VVSEIHKTNAGKVGRVLNDTVIAAMNMLDTPNKYQHTPVEHIDWCFATMRNLNLMSEPPHTKKYPDYAFRVASAMRGLLLQARRE
jgi:hypothetical protein